MDIKRIPHRLLTNGAPNTFTCPPPEEEEFYESLSKYSTLYRILLSRPCAKEVYLDQWNRVDLQLVNELGLPPRGTKEKECWLQIDAQLLLQQGKKVMSSLSGTFTVQTRPIQRDAWDFFNDASSTIPGFQHNTIGGFEYKISMGNNTSSSQFSKIKHTSQTCYLKIFPVQGRYQMENEVNSLDVNNHGIREEKEVENDKWKKKEEEEKEENGNGNKGQATVQAFPLVIGPLVVKPESSRNEKNVLGNHGNNSFYQDDWNNTKISSSQDSFHVFHMLDHSYLVIKEIWKLGTPGKMWDSAIVLSQMFTEMIQSDPARFHKKRILDLSAGTGCVGLVIAATYKRIFNKYKPDITMTDLEEALDLLEYNRSINHLNNHNNIHIKPLKWGEEKDVQLILKDGPIDFIIASDVLYEPSHFSALVSTLDQLVVNEKTSVFLGYKKRGLSQEQESKFFNICSLKFDIVLIDDQLIDFDVTRRNSFLIDGWIQGGFTNLLKETGVQIYKLSRRKKE